MKGLKKLLMSLILVTVFAGVFAKSSGAAASSITRVIGEETVEFSVPSDYDSLLSNYTALVDAYADAENQVLAKDVTITKYVTLVKDLQVANDELKSSITNYSEDSAKLERYYNGARWYLGGTAGVNLATDYDSYFVGPILARAGTKWSIAAYAPVAVTRIDNYNEKRGDIGLAVGLGFAVARRFNL